MAGFFLLEKSDSSLHLDKALKAFSDNGLKNPIKYELGENVLYIYKKLTAEKPCVVEAREGFCAAVGAYIYKGLDYTQSLESTINDYLNGVLDFSEMYGQYTLILYMNKQVLLLSDALSAKHIFSDRQHSFFTSSFFAAVSAVENVTINDMSVFEKMLTGIIISPDTLVNEVIQINKDEQIKINEANCGFSFLIHPDIKILPKHRMGKKESVDAQVECIRRYFETIKPALNEGRVDLGLSAGHDSSLIFAAINSMYRDNLHIHTHSTGHVHDTEKNAAIAMAEVKGITPTIVPTPRLDEPNINLSKLLHENLVFFDGRTSHDIGGFSATYRAEYRLMATDGCMTTFSGVGGECFRNHYSVKGRKIDAESFFADKVFNRSFIEAIPNDLFEKVKRYHLSKAGRILNAKLHGKVDRLYLRRYYSEVLMADGQGNVIDAYNTVSKCIAPFLDPHILQEAYRGIKYLGNCGEYESSIICALDSEVGRCVNANNGYPFSHIPYKLRIKEALRASVSTKIWENLNRLKKRRIYEHAGKYFHDVLDTNEELAIAFNKMKEQYTYIDFDIVIRGYAMDALVEYLAMTLRKITNEQ